MRTIPIELEHVAEKVLSNNRITRQDAARILERGSDELLMTLSAHVRNRYHNADEATYLIMGIINYTNICVAKCDYCSFYRLPHEAGGYLLNHQELSKRIEQVLSLGGTMIGFNGGFHPKLRLQDYAEVFRRIREDFGERMQFYGMTVAEFLFTCKVSKVSLDDGAKLLRDHGSEWITGGGAEILDNGFRKRHSPGKSSVEDYLSAQAALLRNGVGSTATMVIGFDETLDERLNHLEALRTFQDENHRGLKSFLCWTYKPYNNSLGGLELPTRDYLRWLAICRIYLDNFEHIRTSVLTKNNDALLGLNYGANDFDLPTEDEVTEKAGAVINRNFADILSKCQALGFAPIHRKPFARIEAKPLSGAASIPQVSSASTAHP